MSDTDGGNGGDPDVPRYARRTVLRSGAAAIGLGVGGVAAGQETTNSGSNITTLGVTLEQEQFGQGIRGFWIHVGGEVDPIQASVADQCDIVDWNDRETRAYDATLVDRTADPEQARITLYLHARVDLDPGTLFIVNDVVPCRSGYVGVSLEQIGADRIQV